MSIQTMIVTNIMIKTIQFVSIIHLLIYLIDSKHVHSTLKYQTMITTIIGDYDIL